MAFVETTPAHGFFPFSLFPCKLRSVRCGVEAILGCTGVVAPHKTPLSCRIGKGWGWMKLRPGVGEHGELEAENPW